MQNAILLELSHVQQYEVNRTEIDTMTWNVKTLIQLDP